MATGPNWVDLLHHGASLLDRSYHLLQAGGRRPSARAGGEGGSQESGRRTQTTWDSAQLYHALSTAHRVLDALEGKPASPPRRFFW